MTSVRDLDDSILLRTCELFFHDKQPTQKISEEIQAEVHRLHGDFEMSREKVYELIREARRRSFFEILPPQQEALRDRLAAKYGEGFHVVPMTELDHLAAAAAKVVADLIERLRPQKREVHLGLGAGKTSMLVAKHLAIRLRAARQLPKLVFHALTSGFRVTEPHTAPVSFFGFFDAVAAEIEYVGLFAPAFVLTDAWASMRKGPGVKESLERAREIDIVVTALGSPAHKHGDFFSLMKNSPKGFKALEAAGWVGDVQYRPFSAKGPILIDAQVRAVTLFEISDLVELAKRDDKHVVLVAGPCSFQGCGDTRSESIRPLLVEKKTLKVWSTIVTDVRTARELSTSASADGDA